MRWWCGGGGGDVRRGLSDGFCSGGCVSRSSVTGYSIRVINSPVVCTQVRVRRWFAAVCPARAANPSESFRADTARSLVLGQAGLRRTLICSAGLLSSQSCPVYLSIYVSIFPSIYLFVVLSVHPSIHPSIHPPILACHRLLSTDVYIYISAACFGRLQSVSCAARVPQCEGQSAPSISEPFYPSRLHFARLRPSPVSSIQTRHTCISSREIRAPLVLY